MDECDSSPDGKHRLETITTRKRTFDGEDVDEVERCQYCERDKDEIEEELEP